MRMCANPTLQAATEYATAAAGRARARLRDPPARTRTAGADRPKQAAVGGWQLLVDEW
jgi:hypothetical protein